MTTARARILFFSLATLAIAACSANDATSPRLKPALSSPDDIITDSIPNTGCRSGYSTPNGRCTGE